MKVLIVEDSPEIRGRLAAQLGEAQRIEIVGCAEDVPGALALVESRAPDLVVLDIALAGGGRGYDVLRHVARQHPATRVVVLSNYGWDEMRDGFLAGGAAAFFDKALEFEQARRWIVEQSQAVMQ